jgi:hypothetical protein
MPDPFTEFPERRVQMKSEKEFQTIHRGQEVQDEEVQVCCEDPDVRDAGTLSDGGNSRF